jgi:predicted HicB family RNase H-like nuclease
MEEKKVEKKSYKYSRFLFNINDELRHDVKIRAAAKNISMRVWITRAIMNYMKLEDSYK